MIDINLHLSKKIQKTFNYQVYYDKLLSSYDSVQYTAFFDLLEDSMEDMLLVTKGEEGLKIHAIYNNIDRTAFFLKARMISDSKVATPVSEASYRCILTDLNDVKFVAVSGSSGQTAYNSLSTPYSHVGIGRSNNFIE